jgi:enoyl-CoA hydratase/carnithine racemase
MSSELRSIPRGSGSIRLEFESSWAELILDHPERRNAISPGMMVDLEAAVTRLEAWDGALVLMRGQGGRAFCSGGDLRAVEEHLLAPELAESMSAHMSDTLERLSRLPQVLVAAIDGAALGGGAELVLSADRVFMAESAILGFVHITLGVCPGWGAGGRLVSKLGSASALDILLGGRRLSAVEAKSHGLVDQVCIGSAVSEARSWLAEISCRAPEAIRAAVTIARGAGPEQERGAFLSLWGGPAHQQALDRMRNKL